MASLIRCRGLKKTMGNKLLFDDANFNIAENDCIGLLGANGCGKTTLIKMLLGTVQADIGDIEIKENIRIRHLRQVIDQMKGLTVKDFLGETTGTDEIGRKIADLEKKMADPELFTSGDYSTVLEEYQELQEAVGWNKTGPSWSRVRELLKELGMGKLSIGQKLETLSGGERQKLALATILAEPERCDLFLLDEPTNHLDIESIEWFEEKLANLTSAVILVSHDQYLLENLVERVFEMENENITVYEGKYEEYERKKKSREHVKLREYQKHQADIKRQKRSIEKMTRRNKYDRQITSKLKKMEKEERVMDPVFRSYLLKFQFNSSFKSSKNVAQGRNIIKHYDGVNILNKVNFDIEKGQRIGIIGRNGCGKTTFLKMITGEIKPDSGSLNISSGVKWRYFDQAHLSLIQNNTLIEEVIRGKEGLKENDAKALLGRFNFRGGHIYNTVEKLSGGERARLALLRLLLTSSNLLVLDEPTNHVDIMSKKAIEGALNSFEGTIIVVSHDRNFLDRVCDWTFLMSEGEIFPYKGNYTQFKALHRRRFRDLSSRCPRKYLVRKTFTEWTYRKKHNRGEHIHIDIEKEEQYTSAIENGWLKEV